MSETICNCMNVDRETIVKAIREKILTTVEEVQDATTAGTGCGGCVPDIEDILTDKS